MVTLNTVADAQDFVDLVVEIQKVEGLDWPEAAHRAMNLRPQFAVEIVNDLRYALPYALPGEAPVDVHTSWSVPYRGEPAALVACRNVRELVG